MAIAKGLQEPREKINDLMMAKLSLGVKESFEKFVSIMRGEAAVHYCRLNREFLTYVTFQINVQSGFTMYFQAMNFWKKGDHGIATAALKETRNLFRERPNIASSGLPNMSDRSGGLFALIGEVEDFRRHLNLVEEKWNHDITKVYFERIPDTLPVGDMLTKGICMMKSEAWELDGRDLDPVPLALKPK